MSKWEKLLARICALDKGMRFDELRKVLESYGYEMKQTYEQDFAMLKWQQSLYLSESRT